MAMLVIACVALACRVDSLRIQRLATLAEIDGAVHYFHPALSHRLIPWDSAVAATAERITGRMPEAEYSEALTLLLSVLGDTSASVTSVSRLDSLAYSGLPAPRDAGPFFAGYRRRWIVTPDSSVPESDAEARMRDANTMRGGGNYPSRGARLLAAFRVWSTMRFFFAYKDLIGEDWNAAFRGALPLVEAARDSLEYARAIAELCTHLHDSHIRVLNSTALAAAYWNAPTPAEVRMIRGQPVVTRILNDTAARAARIRLGDVVLSVDGRPAAVRMGEIASVMPASTVQARDRESTQYLLNGPENTTVTAIVRHPSGEIDTVRLRREWHTAQTRATGIIALMPGNVGYVDLSRLPVQMVDSVFRRFAHARGIVFDMRGYPQGTAWFIAPHLAARDSVVAAQIDQPYVPSPDTSLTRMRRFTQYIPHYGSESPRYRGRTVMIIDDRTMSQAEHTGLFFEAANGTTFVGTPSAGTNGDLTGFWIPGGLYIEFSGAAIHHADGRQLARIGIIPNVRVEPTIADIAAGRDVVLQHALEIIAAQRPANARR